MNLPILCPLCHHPLMNNFKDYPFNRPSQLEKTCKIKPDHKFICLSRKGCEDEIGTISVVVDMSKNLTFTWVIEAKTLQVSSGFKDKNYNTFPYVHPDLDNLAKLLIKLKNLISFV